MANAHLPNSHPDITPGWKPLSVPRTRFLEAIATVSLEGSLGSRYVGYVPPDWCTRAGRRLAAHGGFCAAVLLTVARAYCRNGSGQGPPLSPMHMHVEYLEPMPQGSFHVVVKRLHSGNRSMTIRVELVPPEGDEATIYSAALIRMGVLQDALGNNNMQPVSPRLPNRETECGRWSDALYYYNNPPTSSIRLLCPNDGQNIFWSPRFSGQHTRDQWTKLDDDGLLQAEHIPLIVDLITPIPLNYEEDALQAAVNYKIPTMSLTINFCTEIKDEEWLLTRTTMQRLHGGRFDMDIKVINDNGDIVATCIQLCAMIPRTGQQTSLKAAL